MSPIDLRIYFAGLAVFAEDGQIVRTLLPDARRGRDLGDLGRAEPHYAVIQFDQRQARGNPPFETFTDRRGMPKGYWLLDKDFVTLDPDLETEEHRLDFRRNGRNGEPTPTTGNAQSIEWVAPLSGLGGASPQFKTALLNPVGRKLKETEPLAGLVLLDRGQLSPVGFASEVGGFVIGQFPNGSQQALASVVGYRATVEAPSVRLVSRKFDGSPGESLELKPRDEDAHRVEVWVLNRGWEGIARQRPPRRVEIGTPNPDYIFFNNLIENPIDEHDLPRTVKRLPGGATLSDVMDPCRDPAMRQLYFPDPLGGETLNASPCSPAHG